MRGNLKYISKMLVKEYLATFKAGWKNKPRKIKKQLTNSSLNRVSNLRRYQLAALTQAIGRATRNGQTKPVMYATMGIGKSDLRDPKVTVIIGHRGVGKTPYTMNCEHCGKALKPAPAKLRADGEQTYCGFLPCACNCPIATDMGVVNPGTEDHDILLKTGNYSTNDLLTPLKK